MAEEKLLTIRDAALLLGISEKEVMNLAESGAIPAYKVGGVYLRFKRQQVEEFKKSHKVPEHKARGAEEYSLGEKIGDFFYFYDFYIIAVIFIIIIISIIFKG